MLIDTHTHINDLTGVDKIIYSGADRRRNQEVFAAASADTTGRIFCTLGFHTSEVDETNFDYESLLSHPKVVGVGEIGLDYYFGTDLRAEQIALFEKQLEIVRRAKLPVCIHSRDATADMIKIAKDLPAGGVMHCFTGSFEFAKIMMDRGFFISASGVVTFKNAHNVRETFSKIPLDKIVVETDAPWCAPVPFRGKECRPAMVIETVRVLAEIKNIPFLEIEEIVWHNAHKLYGKLNGTTDN